MNKAKISYQATNLPWCPEIPEHWKLKKLKYVARAQPSNVDKKTEVNEIPVKLCNYVDVYKNDFITDSIDFMEASATKDEIEKFRLAKSDVLITKDSETPQDIAVPSLVRIEKNNLVCGYHLAQIRSDNSKIIGEYLFRLFQSKNFNSTFEIAANGITRFGLSIETIKSVSVFLPPLREQQRIAEYLDKKTEQIDQLIANKEKLIESLKEERIAIINHAVTKGINPKAKLKSSGVEWIGEIPEDWEVKKLKYLVSKIGSGITPSGGATVYVDKGIPLLRSQNIMNQKLELNDVAYITEEIDNTMKNSRIKEGDVLLNITGASIGRCHYIPINFGKGNVNQHVCIIRPVSENILTEYLHFVMISFVGQTQIDLQQTGANREGLNFEQLKNFLIPLPNTFNQKKIVLYLKKSLGSIDLTISQIKEEIELIKEYKTALINEVVTGKKIIS